MTKRTFSGSVVQHKTGTSAQWTSVNPTLAKGEIGVEIDTGRIKIGDGVTAWNSLPYVFAGTYSPIALAGNTGGTSKNIAIGGTLSTSNYGVVTTFTPTADSNMLYLPTYTGNETYNAILYLVNSSNTYNGIISNATGDNNTRIELPNKSIVVTVTLKPGESIILVFNQVVAHWMAIGGTNLFNTLQAQIQPLPVGHIQQQYIVETGYLALDGSTYSRVTYAALWAWAQANNLIGTSNYQFGTGDGSTTFTVPNHTGRVWQGGSAIGQKEAGVPDITGLFNLYTWDNGNPHGCFSGNIDSNNVITPGSGSSYNYNTINFSAAKSNSIYGASTTVQPPAIVLIPQIKY